MLVGGAVERRRGFPVPGAAPLRGAGQSAFCVPPQRPAVENPGSGRRAGGQPLALGWAGGAVRSLQRRYDMNGRFQMQGGKNWILPKQINANRFFWDSHWLEIWSNHFCPIWNRMEGAWLWTQGFSRNVDSRHLVRLVVELQDEVFGTSIYERATSGEFSRRPYTKYIITFHFGNS